MTVLLGNSDERSDREDAYLDLFREQRVNGVLVTPVDDLARLERLRTGGVPVVLVDRETPAASSGRSPSTTSRAGTWRCRTCSRSAAAGSPSSAVRASIRQVADRLEGARRAVAEVPGATLEVIEMPALRCCKDARRASCCAAGPRRTGPDAVFAANDLLAVGAAAGASPSWPTCGCPTTSR